MLGVLEGEEEGRISERNAGMGRPFPQMTIKAMLGPRKGK